MVFLKKMDLFSTILATVMVASFLIMSNLAYGAPEKTNQVGYAKTNLPKSFPKPAKLVPPNYKVTVGDFVLLQRPFHDWLLRCEFLVSVGRRLCSTQQTLSSGNAKLIWRVILDEAGKPYVLIAAPPDIDISKGLLIKFSGLEKVLQAEKDIACSQASCVAAFAFDDTLQVAMMSSKIVSFQYRSISGAERKFSGSMIGLELALKSAGDEYDWFHELSEQKE